ncbi:5652_t:CDS:2 [Paraglomus brasilianum]|uniref:5652_t:CDS:1 n=1 Tax=Paraglomus brasilianum TaxID=144538 RepID=A0A9N9F4Q5_9GLOM|nr:5652_t:CDS:2 [Paraglomus brasilianum]
MRLALSTFSHSFRLSALYLFVLLLLSISSLTSADGNCDTCGQTVTLVAPCLSSQGNSQFQTSEQTATTSFVDPTLANCQCTNSYLAAYQSSKGLSTSGLTQTGDINNDCRKLGTTGLTLPPGSSTSGSASGSTSMRLNGPSMNYAILVPKVLSMAGSFVVVGILSQMIS